jgi:DNA-binding CsgD family transcriptional regulator
VNKLEGFSYLLEALYGAALDPSRWAAIAPLMARTFGTQSCSIQIHDRHSGEVENLSQTSNYNTEPTQDYQPCFYKGDLWVAGPAAKPSGFAFDGDELVDNVAFARAEIYTDYCRRLDIFYVMGRIMPLGVSSHVGMVASKSDDIGLIGVDHPRDAGDFRATTKRELELILPHLQHAFQMQIRLRSLAQERRAALETLKCLSIGVLLLKEDCGIVFANSIAEHVIRTADALVVYQGRLRTRDPAKLANLEALIRSATLTGGGVAFQAGGVLMLARPKGRPLSLLICSMSQEGRGRPTALMFVGDINEQEPEPSGRGLARMYGFTAAETRVVNAILAGHRLNEYADTAGISINTVKTQLKQVFAKTGHSRQAELIREAFANPILRLPPHLLERSTNVVD